MMVDLIVTGVQNRGVMLGYGKLAGKEANRPIYGLLKTKMGTNMDRLCSG
jgi:hypothetical protein